MFLQDLALIILKRGLTGWTLIYQEEDPCNHGIDDKEVDVNNWHVFVPNSAEIRVEGKVINWKEIFDPWGYYGDEGDVVTGLEAKDVGVYQQWYEDGIEDDEVGVYGGLGEHTWWLGGRTHEVYQLVNDQAEEVVGYASCEDDRVLDALRNLNTSEVGGANCLDGVVTERGN